MGKLGVNINDQPENFKLPQTPPRNPPPTTEYVGQQVMCKGSLALGSGCGRCSRCKQEIKSLLEYKRCYEALLRQQKDIGAEYEQALLNNLDDLYEE